jgi:hypothetical protein
MSYTGASVDTPRVSSEFASGRGGWDAKGGIVRENVPIVSSHADAVINVGANQAAGISIQFNHPDGTPISAPQDFVLYVVSLTAGMVSSLATTGGSGSNAGITNGSLQAGFIANTALAKKMFQCFTNATGLFQCTWTDNAAEVAYLDVVLPSGRNVISAQLPTS